jgi:hypothetical protein
MSPSTAKDLHTLLSGGLHVDDKSEGLTVYDAAIRVAAAQLRAIRFALATNNDTGQPEPVDGRQGWDFGDSFGKADAIIALGGVMAMLDNAYHVSHEVMRVLEESEAEVRQ